MDSELLPCDEKRAYQRSPVCRKIRFTVGPHSYRGLIGDISTEGACIISKYRFLRGVVIDLSVPPMSGTVQYCIPYRKDFFRTGLRLLPELNAEAGHQGNSFT